MRLAAMAAFRRDHRRARRLCGATAGVLAPAERSLVVIKLESRRLRKAFAVLEQHLSDRDYLLASGFSAVDTAVGYSVHLGRQLIGIAGLPLLAAYYARLQARPAFARANEQAPIKAMAEVVRGLT